MARINLALERRRLLQIEFSPGWILSAAIVLLYLFFIVSPVLSIGLLQSGVGIGRYLDELAFAALVPLIVVAVIVSGHIYISPYIIWLILFTTVGAISTWLAEVPLNVAAVGALQALKPAVIFILFQSIPLNRRHADVVLRGIDVLFSWMPVLAVIYLVVFEVVLGNNPLPAINESARLRLGISPLRSFFPHANQLGSMMVMAATWQFSWLVVKGERIRLIPLLAAGFCILATVRMKPMFGLPLVLVLIYILHRVRHGTISRGALFLGIGALGFVVAAILLLSTQTSLREVIEDRIGENTASVRTVLLQSAIELNLETYGLGVGFGRFGSPASAVNYYSPLYARFGIDQLPGATPEDPLYITNQWWAWFLAEVGFVGMALFLLMLTLVSLFLYRVARMWYQTAPALAALAYASLGMLVYGVGTGAAGAFLTGPPTAYYAMSLAGLTYAVQRAYEREGAAALTEQP